MNEYGSGGVGRFARGGTPRIPAPRGAAHDHLWVMGFNDEIHQPARFMIMSLLVRSRAVGLHFRDIRDALRLTDGNLSSHLLRLVHMEYIDRYLDCDGRKRFTVVTVSDAGRVAYERHVGALQELIAGWVPRDG